MNCEPAVKRPRGRPRGFDREEALDRAVEVFWREGYDGATVAELCRATGLNPPSLYAAFGDKARLFEAALDRYQATTGGFAARVLMEAPTAEAAVEACSRLRPTRWPPPAGLAVPGRHRGAHLRRQDGPRSGRQPPRPQLRRHPRSHCSRRVGGELPPGEDVDALTRFVVSVFQGMGVQARDGATPEQLRAVAHGPWPPGPGRSGLTPRRVDLW
jgi:AcrR family transcriptional regulator